MTAGHCFAGSIILSSLQGDIFATNTAEGDNCTIGLEYNLHPLRRSAKEKICHAGLDMTADMTVKV